MAFSIVGAHQVHADDNSNHPKPCNTCNSKDIVWYPPPIDPPEDPPKDPPTPDPEPDPPLESDCIDRDGDGENDDDCQTVERGFWDGDGGGGTTTGPFGPGSTTGPFGTGPIILQ